jgi:NADPH:quinone reductase-like Zn-dependent oxidoreductase
MYWITIAQTVIQTAGKVTIEVAALFSKTEENQDGSWTGKYVIKFYTAPVSAVVKSLAEKCPTAVLCICAGINTKNMNLASMKADGRSILIGGNPPVELTHACLQRSLKAATPKPVEEPAKEVIIVEEPTPAP